MSVKKQTFIKWGRDLLIFAVVIAVIVSWQKRDMLDTDGTISIPPMKLVSLEGKVEPLHQSDKRTLVYFFAPWCSVCAVSIGNLDFLDTENINIVKVALDYESVNDIEKFVLENEVSGTILLGTNELKQQFRIPGYPTYYLLDKNSRVIGSSFGYSSAIGLKLKNYLSQG